MGYRWDIDGNIDELWFCLNMGHTTSPRVHCTLTYFQTLACLGILEWYTKFRQVHIINIIYIYYIYMYIMG